MHHLEVPQGRELRAELRELEPEDRRELYRSIRRGHDAGDPASALLAIGVIRRTFRNTPRDVFLSLAGMALFVLTLVVFLDERIGDAIRLAAVSVAVCNTFQLVRLAQARSAEAENERLIERTTGAAAQQLISRR